MGLKVEADWERSVIRVRQADAAPAARSQSGSRLKTVDAEQVEWPALVTVSSSGWDAAAPKTPSQAVLVGRALSSVVPPEFANLEVEYSGVSAANKVTWSGKTRRDALLSIEKALGVKVMLTPRGLFVSSENASRNDAIPKIESLPSPGDMRHVGSSEQKVGKPDGDVLLSGDTLSSRLEKWLREHGWSLSWALDYDYFLEKDLPLMGDTIDAKVEFILRAYQAQGGLTNARARIASANRVVVFEGVDYAAR
jgi:hypothetical protein